MSTLPVGVPVDAKPAPRPGRVTLDGRFVSVVPFDLALHGRDIFALSAGRENEDLWAYLGQGPFADYEAFAAHYAVAQTRDDPLLFAIVDKASGRAVGHATYLRIAPADRAIEVGNLLFTPALQRTPGATEAMYLMMRHAFDDLGYRRYEWKCNDLNAPSRRAALRLGFTYEGTFRQHMIIKGRNRDTAWFSLLDHEWPRANAAFEAWLDPANFDAEGRQIRRLEDLRA
ncbi:GNAT family protein [Kaistia dalseonensis]|uniref:RimJ/RimL family protein N-acetyltransferase n=1 Tax=Kaistia dalseonensis TaxID=410840 RepID=A0ABU0HB58_9HYPH|nr:GNAT family protein [Kaistia dalseonensis]MCX5496874.1 GNAT family protein [Kaistia dalseonensis]MDQ0439500.1 RimJ/RimL family protein N-acetyltransferase [Kaistia dalseonensis]